MENFEIVEYNTALVQAAEAQFARYVREDLKETFSDEILYEEIWRGIFVSGLEKGLLSIALPMLNGEPVGLLVYQVDTPESDWCKREGWGLSASFASCQGFAERGMACGWQNMPSKGCARKPTSCTSPPIRLRLNSGLHAALPPWER